METKTISLPSLLFAGLSGLFLFFSFPKYGTGWVAWVALIPLLYVLAGKNLRSSFTLGFTAGFIAHIGIMYWIAYVVVQYGYLPLYMGIAAMLLLSAYLSLYTGLFALGVSYLKDKKVPVIATAPVLWTILEYVKSQILTGFPWENLGYSQFDILPVIQISDITGVYGVTFLIVFINALLYDLITVEAKPSIKVLKASIGVVLMAVVVGYGVYRMDDIRRFGSTLPVQPVGLIQGNVDQTVKWNPKFQKQTMADYAALTVQVSNPHRQLIVWPETAVPFFFQDQDDFHRAIVDLAGKTKAWLLFGSPSYQFRPDGLTLFNSAYLLSPDGRNITNYDKVHLVPYGEYVPLRQWFPFINKLVQGVGDFGTGKGYIPLSMDGHRIGVLICYEGIFPESGRTYRRNGAELLVNITNDAWFGETSAPYQHLSMTVFRAVENRLYLIRAANTGISAVIDPAGKIESRTGLFEKAVLQGAIRFIDKSTFYSTCGDVFIYVCIFSLAVLLIITRYRRKTP